MIKVVVMTHSNLAYELVNTLKGIVGEKDFIETLAFSPDVDYDFIKRKIESLVKEAKGCKLLLVTDMFGGTPSNIALSFLKEGEVEVVTGVNLPMLVKISQLGPNIPLKELVEKAVEAGRKNIIVASEILKKRVNSHGREGACDKE